MPTQILLAPATGGKTTYTINLARETAVSLQAEVRVCVPTGLQARAWRQRLATAGGAIGVHVLTFDRLVATCLNEAGEAYTELSEPVLYRLLRQIIDQLPLQHYAPLKTKPGFIQIVYQLIVELKSALIYPESFASALTQLGNAPRLQELASIYTAYQTQLQAQGWADRVGLHWLAAEALSERSPDIGKNWPMLIVDGFDDFAPSQLALIHLLASRLGQCIITLPHTEQVTYPRYHNTLQEVETKLGIIGAPLPNPEAAIAHQPTLHHLAHHLFSLSTGCQGDLVHPSMIFSNWHRQMDKVKLIEQRELEEKTINLQGNGRFRITFPTNKEQNCSPNKTPIVNGAVVSQPIMAHSNVSFC